MTTRRRHARPRPQSASRTRGLDRLLDATQLPLGIRTDAVPGDCEVPNREGQAERLVSSEEPGRRLGVHGRVPHNPDLVKPLHSLVNHGLVDRGQLPDEVTFEATETNRRVRARHIEVPKDLRQHHQASVEPGLVLDIQSQKTGRGTIAAVELRLFEIGDT